MLERASLEALRLYPQALGLGGRVEVVRGRAEEQKLDVDEKLSKEQKQVDKDLVDLIFDVVDEIAEGPSQVVAVELDGVDLPELSEKSTMDTDGEDDSK